MKMENKPNLFTFSSLLFRLGCAYMACWVSGLCDSPISSLLPPIQFGFFLLLVVNYMRVWVYMLFWALWLYRFGFWLVVWVLKKGCGLFG